MVFDIYVFLFCNSVSDADLRCFEEVSTRVLNFPPGIFSFWAEDLGVFESKFVTVKKNSSTERF